MVLSAPPRPSEITFKEFEEWTEAVGVKRAQQEWEKLSEEAQANKRSAVAEMHARGFKDFREFQKACERFKVTCWPMEFSELGSGYVLYFQFLITLGLLLFLMVLLQIPIMAAYGSEDLGCEWLLVSKDAWDDLLWGGDAAAHPWSGCPNEEEALDVTFLSPGNFGASQSTNSWIPSIYTALVIIVCVIVFFAYQIFVLMDKRVDANTTSPADFAIMVKGLPALATDEKEIAKFFREHAIKGKTDTEIVKVVIGWDAEEFRSKLDRIKEIRKAMAELEPTDEKVKELQSELKTIQTALNAAATGGECANRLKGSGVVVVTFRWIEDQQRCLERWTGFWPRYLKKESSEGLCGSLFPGPTLPKFPVGNPPIPVYSLKVEQAAEPGDIMWEHLAVPGTERWYRFAQTWGAMIACLLVSFLVAWLLILGKDETANQKDAAEGTSSSAWSALSSVTSILILLNNIAIALFARWLGGKEFHDTQTQKEFSLALKMSWGMILNTAGVLFWVKATPPEWYTGVSLVSDIWSMVLIDALMFPIINSLDLGYNIRRMHRKNGCTSKRLTQAKLDGWNETMQRLAPKKNRTPEEEKELNTIKMSVAFYKRAYEPSAMKMSRAYANALKTFVVCVMFSPLLPWVSLFGLVGVTLQYWADKYLLLRWFKRPDRPANAQMAKFSLFFIKCFVPILLSISFFLFLSPSWAKKAVVSSSFFTSIAVGAIFAFAVPLELASGTTMKILGCLGFDVSRNSDREVQDYYKAQHMWSAEMKYHKDQFYYKKLPESKNPEMLTLGQDAAIGIDDVKAVAGEGAKGLAEAAADGSKQAPRLRGHFTGSATSGPAQDSVLGSASSKSFGVADVTSGSVSAAKVVPGDGGQPAPTGSWGVPTATSAGVAPATIGAPTDSGPAPKAKDADDPLPATAATTTQEVKPAPAPPGVVDSDTEEVGGKSAPPATSSKRTEKIIWEFLWDGDHWSAFNDDCQSFIESRYQRYEGDHSKEYIKVRTQGFEVSIDFERMTTKKKGAPDIRKVRRRVS